MTDRDDTQSRTPDKPFKGDVAADTKDKDSSSDKKSLKERDKDVEPDSGR